MRSIELYDLKCRLTALSKSVAEITDIVSELIKIDPLNGGTLMDVEVVAELPEVRMLAAHVVKEVRGGKSKLRDALVLCKAESVTTLFETPEQCPKFIKLLEKACGKTLAQVTAKIEL